jgi:hypothetical protein
MWRTLPFIDVIYRPINAQLMTVNDRARLLIPVHCCLGLRLSIRRRIDDAYAVSRTISRGVVAGPGMRDAR